LRIHALNEYSLVNGPGVRSVIHFQGCKFACPGCFNPETHSMSGGFEITVDEVINKIPTDIDGVTISGGEPFLQQEALLELVKRIRTLGHSIVIFSGFYMYEIQNLKHGPEILKYVDALIDGRFDQSVMSVDGLHGSDNQTIHLLTDRYSKEDFVKREVEFTFDMDGNVRITGFPSMDLLQEIQK
jgi:anaerobic ribonucleoside-triphosphate reductase activating protein